MTTTANGRLDVATLKAAAAGRWLEILTSLGGLAPDLLDGRNHPCPLCAGTDRFSLVNEERGAVICRHCFNKSNGDGLAALCWLRGWTFPTAARELAAYLGLTPTEHRSRPGPPLEELARVKRCPAASLRAYGAREERGAVVFPAYDPAGRQCTTFTIWPHADDEKRLKGLFAKGKPAGLFLPHQADGTPCLPQPGETWLIVEGVKDAAALHGLGYLACGLNRNELAQHFVRLFRAAHVVIVPDRDVAGTTGAEATARRLFGHAASLCLAHLPGEIAENHGLDVRDVLAKTDGETLVREAIEYATAWQPPAGPAPPTPDPPPAAGTEPQPVTARDLLARFPRLREPIIDGLARRGETINVVSVSKAGKSWLAYSLLLSTCTGARWLETFDCTPGRVLLIDNELHPETLARRLDAAAYALQIPDAQWRDALDVVCLRGKAVDLYALRKTLLAIKPGTYTLVIADAWYRFLPAGTDENSNADVMQLYNTIDTYAEHLAATWVNIHHASKGNQAGKAVTDVGSGAGSQSRAADTHLILRPHEEENVVVLEAAVRSFPPVEPFALRWNYPLWSRANDADPRKLRRQMTPSEEKQAHRDEEGKAQIVAALAKHTAGTEANLRDWTDITRERCHRLVIDLLRAGSLAKTTIQIRGNACAEYRLAPPERDVVGH